MDYHAQVAIIFDFFYQRIYKSPGFQLDLDVNNQRKQVDNFVKLISKHYPLQSIGTNFLIEYFCFAFHYWSDKVTKRRISLNWIIGKKLFQRWLDKADSQKYFDDRFLYENDINLDVLRFNLAQLEEKQGLDASEEIEKQRHRGEARLFHCLQYTTMYNHRSEICRMCSENITCKKLLKVEYPAIYRKRGYK